MGFHFYRQRIIGRYIVDFCCPAAKLIIELDGRDHYLYRGRICDERRDEYLRRRGFRVLRFNERRVFTDLDGVIEEIRKNLAALTKKK